MAREPWKPASLKGCRGILAADGMQFVCNRPAIGVVEAKIETSPAAPGAEAIPGATFNVPVCDIHMKIQSQMHDFILTQQANARAQEALKQQRREHGAFDAAGHKIEIASR